MLTPIELLQRELLNHYHLIDEYRDPQVAGYVVEEVAESKKQIEKLNKAIRILEEYK